MPAPGRASQLVVSAPTVSSLHLAASVPSGPVTHWEYRARVAPQDYETEWSTIRSTSLALGETLTGLAPGTDHTFIVRAVNSDGAGRASAPSSTVPTLPEAPTAPEVVMLPGGALRFAAGLSGTCTTTRWDYRVFAATQGWQAWRAADAPVGQPYLSQEIAAVPNVARSAALRLQVRARNASGTGAVSPQSSVARTLGDGRPGTNVAWLLEFDLADPDYADHRRFWSGPGTLTFDGHDWQGIMTPDGPLITLGPLQRSQEGGERMTATLAIVANAQRARLLRDFGPVPIELRWIYGGAWTDGAAWSPAPVRFRGFLSAPRILNDLYVVDIETWASDVDRGVPVIWSNETLQAQAPGDLGFEYLRSLSEGVHIRWPH